MILHTPTHSYRVTPVIIFYGSVFQRASWKGVAEVQWTLAPTSSISWWMIFHLISYIGWLFHFSSISLFKAQTVTLTHIFTCMYRQKKRVDNFSKLFKTLIPTTIIRKILILCFPFRSGYWRRTFKKRVPNRKRIGLWKWGWCWSWSNSATRKYKSIIGKLRKWRGRKRSNWATKNYWTSNGTAKKWAINPHWNGELWST